MIGQTTPWMTFDLSSVRDMLLLCFLVVGTFVAIGMAWDWVAWKLREKRVERHATERWLTRQRKKESEK